MSDRILPNPIATGDEYLAAIHDRLGEILDRLPERSAPERQDGTVELSEPKRPAAGKGKAKPGGTRPAGSTAGGPRPARSPASKKPENT